MNDSVTFGVFEFEPASGALRRAGIEVRLQAQPARVLAMLIEARGELVPRERLREAIWGSSTHVDFDRGLNFCIAQIRTALGDSADSPRFIRTVPKRGYQFIAPLTLPSPADSQDGGNIGSEKPTLEPQQGARSRRAWILPFAGGGLSLAAAIWIKRLMGRSESPRDIVAVARFDNETGNADGDRLADGITDSLVAELTSALAGRFGVIGNAKVLRRPRKERDLAEIGKTLGCRYVILGQVQQSGERLRVLAHLITLPTQAHIRVARIEEQVTDRLAAETSFAGQISRTLAPKIN